MSQRDKPRLSLKNNTAGVREREDANRTREAGNRDAVEGVVASALKLYRNGAVGFIDGLDRKGDNMRIVFGVRFLPNQKASWPRANRTANKAKNRSDHTVMTPHQKRFLASTANNMKMGNIVRV